MKPWFSSLDLWGVIQWLVSAGILSFVGNKIVSWFQKIKDDSAIIRVRQIDDGAQIRVEARQDRQDMFDRIEELELKRDTWIEEKIKLHAEIAELKAENMLLQARLPKE